MDGIHDMGGMHGFGPIEREENEPLFHHLWESRVLAISVATPVPIPGGSRNNIENMDPAHYLSSSYYEKWLYSRIKGLIGRRRTNPGRNGNANGTLPPTIPMPKLRYTPIPMPSEQNSCDRVPLIHPNRKWTSSHNFPMATVVKACNIHPDGTLRLPRYVRGKYRHCHQLLRH